MSKESLTGYQMFILPCCLPLYTSDQNPSPTQPRRQSTGFTPTLSRHASVPIKTQPVVVASSFEASRLDVVAESRGRVGIDSVPKAWVQALSCSLLARATKRPSDRPTKSSLEQRTVSLSSQDPYVSPVSSPIQQ